MPYKQHSSTSTNTGGKTISFITLPGYELQANTHCLCCRAGLTSEFVQLATDRVHNEHVRSLVALSYRGTNQGQGTTGPLTLPLLIDKVVQLSQIRIQNKVPAEENTDGGKAWNQESKQLKNKKKHTHKNHFCLLWRGVALSGTRRGSIKGASSVCGCLDSI